MPWPTAGGRRRHCARRRHSFAAMVLLLLRLLLVLGLLLVLLAGDELQRGIQWSIPGHLPAIPRWRRGCHVAIVGPNLVTSDFWSKPPTAEIWAIALIPVVNKHCDVVACAPIFLVHRLVVVGIRDSIRSLDDV